MTSAGILFVCSQPRQDALLPLLNLPLVDAGIIPVFADSAKPDLLTLEAALRRVASDVAPDLLLVAGGSGCGPRDCAPEALHAVCSRMVPGIPERIRAALPPTEALFFRGCAGFRKRTLLINLPEDSAPSALVALLPLLAELPPQEG